MAVGFKHYLALTLLGSLAPAFSGSGAVRAAESVAPTVSPSPDVISMGQGAADPSPISVTDGNSLLRQFRRDQELELIQLGNDQKAEIRALKSTQKLQLKGWEAEERKARHAFFAKNTKGPDRRAFVKDYLARRASYLDGQAAQRGELVKLHTVQHEQLKQRQLEFLREFQKSLDRGEKPDRSLWPKTKKKKRRR